MHAVGTMHHCANGSFSSLDFGMNAKAACQAALSERTQLVVSFLLFSSLRSGRSDVFQRGFSVLDNVC